MECNVGGVEKNVRLATGAVAIALGLLVPMRRGARLAAVSFGLVELTTALSGYCPVNQLVGRNSCEPDLRDLPKEAEKALRNAQQFAA